MTTGSKDTRIRLCGKKTVPLFFKIGSLVRLLLKVWRKFDMSIAQSCELVWYE